MKYSKLIKEIRTELSEATIADKEKEYVRAKACLLHVSKIIKASMKKGSKDG